MIEYKIKRIENYSNNYLEETINEIIKDGWKLAFEPDINTRSCTDGTSVWFGKITFIRDKN